MLPRVKCNIFPHEEILAFPVKLDKIIDFVCPTRNQIFGAILQPVSGVLFHEDKIRHL